jgi:glycosyltransferase involved in cell wall biosynthesis
MKASILIPAFNAADFIEETLQSCLNQGNQHIEQIIVVDDHSTDETSALVQAVKERNPSIPIHVVLNPDKGACSARNYALSLAIGEAIQWLDADDLLGPGKLSAQLALLRDHPEHLIASKWRRFAGSLDNLWPEEKGSWAEVPQHSSPREWLLSERMMIPAGWLGTRKLFQSIQPWDESLLINQDGEYFTRAIAASAGVVFEAKSRVYYRSSMTGSVSHFKPDKAPSLYHAAESFENTVLTLGKDTAIKTLISNHYQGFIYRVYPLVPELRKNARAKIQQYGKPTRANDVAESRFAKLFCWLFGWKLLVQLRRLRSK